MERQSPQILKQTQKDFDIPYVVNFLRILFPLFALFLLAQSFRPLVAQAGELSLDTYTQAGPFNMTVRFKEGYDAWAQAILDEAPPYIRLVERYLGSRFQFGDSLIFEGCDDCTSRAELQAHTIYLNYLYSTPDDVSVLFHEINHFWFYYYRSNSSDEWIIEGISSFLPNAIRDKRMLPDTPLYHETIDKYWGLEWAPPATRKDMPLYPFKHETRSIVYHKSYLLQYLFYCQLGQKKYLSFVKRVASMRQRRPAQVIHLLNSLKKANWRKALKGWVVGASYRGVSYSGFMKDDDSDGLFAGRESCYRSNPQKYDTDGDLLPDGAEILLGRNPRRADSDGLNLLKEHGPFIDGSDQDWSYFDAAVSTDPSGDAQTAEWADMQEMLTLIKNDTLYVLVKTAQKTQKTESVFFDVLVDTDSDWYTNDEFAFMVNNPKYPWHYSYATKSSESPPALKGAGGSNFEIAIPLSSIPSQSFQILPIIRDDSLKQNYDSWDEWVAIIP